MIRFLLRLSLCTAALTAVTTTVAHAADFGLLVIIENHYSAGLS
jgi:hypothetical protein